MDISRVTREAHDGGGSLHKYIITSNSLWCILVFLDGG